MKKLIAYLLILPFLAACGRGVGHLSTEDQIRYHGVKKGEPYQGDRVSQAREAYVPVKGKDGIDLSDFKINFIEEDRKLSVNLKYLKSVGGKSIDFRLYIDGYFTDFTKPAVLKDPRSTTGDIVRGYAFCKEPLNEPNKCTYVVVDLYFLGLNDKLDKIQIEKRLDADFNISEVSEVSETPGVSETSEVSEAAEPNPSNVEESTTSTVVAEQEPVDADSSTAEDAIADEVYEDVPSIPGDIQTQMPLDMSFYQDFVKPNVNAPVPKTPYERAQEKKVAPDMSGTSSVSVDGSESPESDTNRNGVVQPEESSTTDNKSKAPVKKPKEDNKENQESTRSEPPQTTTVAESKKPESDIGLDAVSVDEINGDRTAASVDFESVAQLQQKQELLFQTIGIGGAEDRNQAVGHYADKYKDKGRAKLTGATIRLGLDGDHVGIVRDDGVHDAAVSFGTSLMIKSLIYFGEWTKNELGASLVVDDIAKQGGGKLGGHNSHKNGLDVDVIYIGYKEGKFDVEKNWKLLKEYYETGVVSSIFVSQQRKNQFCSYARENGLTQSTKEFTKRLYVVKNHTNHFHLRLKCTKLNQACRNDPDFKWDPCK